MIDLFEKLSDYFNPEKVKMENIKSSNELELDILDTAGKLANMNVPKSEILTVTNELK